MAKTKKTKTQPAANPAKRRARSTKAKVSNYEEGAKALVDAAKKSAVEAERTDIDMFLRNEGSAKAYEILLLLREHWAGGAS